MDDPLLIQCLRRAVVHHNSASRGMAPDPDALARQAAGVIRRNVGRIPASPLPNPATGVPDAYVDEVIASLIEEGPRVNALRAGDYKAWEDILRLIHQRVLMVLRPFVPCLGDRLDALVDDLVAHCAAVLWLSLDRFPFDTSLRQWTALFVIYEVKTIRKSADFRWNNMARSLDRPLTPDPGALTLAETLPDGQAAQVFDQADHGLTLDAGLRRLSPGQARKR